MENEISNTEKTNFEEFKVSLSSIDYEGPLSILFYMLNCGLVIFKIICYNSTVK